MRNSTYGHTPYAKAFDQADVYGIGFDAGRASRKKIALGIIGAGGVCQSKYLPAIARLRMLWEPVEMVAFAEPREDQATKVQAVYGGRWHRDVQSLLRDEPIDGVIVLSPDNLHAEHATVALEMGLPVLVEKPITRSLTDSAHLCRLADDKGVVLMAVANKRLSPPYRYAKHYVDEGPVCHPALLAGKFNLGYPYVDLLEAGVVHLFDLARYFMGDVQSVHAAGVNRYGHNPNYGFDNIAITLRFTSGAVGSIIASATALSFKPWERLEVYGDGAWLAVEDQRDVLLYDGELTPTKSWSPVVPNTLLFDEEFGGYMGLIENFLQAIRGEESPIVTGWDGHRALELCVACQRSVQQDQLIELPLAI